MKKVKPRTQPPNPENISAGRPTKFCQNFQIFFGIWGLTFWGMRFDSLGFGVWCLNFWGLGFDLMDFGVKPQTLKSQNRNPKPRKKFERTDQSGVNSNRAVHEVPFDPPNFAPKVCEMCSHTCHSHHDLLIICDRNTQRVSRAFFIATTNSEAVHSISEGNVKDIGQLVS